MHAHLCHLHPNGKFTFHFHARTQTEGLQRTICMPIYIAEYWIVTCCVLILWIYFFFLKLNIFYCWTAGTKCRVSLHSLEKPHQPWIKIGLPPAGWWRTSSRHQLIPALPEERRQGPGHGFLKELTTQSLTGEQKAFHQPYLHLWNGDKGGGKATLPFPSAYTYQQSFLPGFSLQF